MNGTNNPTIDTYSIINHLGEKKDIQKASYTSYYSKYELRNIIVPSENNQSTPWLMDSGSNIRAQAVFEAHNAKKVCLSNLRNKNIRYFELKYKRKRSPSWTMNIDRTNITKYYKGFSLYSESGIIKTKEDFEIDNDCKITFDGVNYFLLVSYIKKRKSKKDKNYFASLDPGERKFNTVYSEDHCINLGQGASSRIYRLLLKLDNAISNKNKKLQRKLRIKIKNLQLELHHKTSTFLCDNYHNIVVPKFNKNNYMIRKSGRKIRSKTVRRMSSLAHNKFLEMLKTKAEEHEDVFIHETTEEYTSQTCLKCQMRTKTSNEIFKCSNCHLEIDRDFLGSRNILLKYWNLL